MAITLGGSADCIFRRLEVYQGSNVLEQIDQYNNLSSMLMNSQISPIDRAYQWSVLKGTHTTLGTKTGLSTGTLNPNNATTVSNYYTTTLLSGVVGSLSLYSVICIKWLYCFSFHIRFAGCSFCFIWCCCC